MRDSYVSLGITLLVLASCVGMYSFVSAVNRVGPMGRSDWAIVAVIMGLSLLARLALRGALGIDKQAS